MTDKKEGPAKGPERSSADPAGGKRPFATIDLKATEVAPTKAEASAASTSATSTASGQSATAEKVVAAGRDLKSGVAQSASASAASAPAAKSAAAQTGPSPKSDAPPAPSAKAAPVPAQSAGGFGRTLSHLVAGLLGGAVAVVGAPHLATLTGIDLQRPQSTAVSGLAPDHAARLNVLEKQVRERLAAPQAADPARAAANEQANAKLEGLTRQVAELSQTQTKLVSESAALRDDLAKAKPLLDAGERIAKLEEQLTQMANAASADPQRAGRLPQLAQLTGQLADLKSSIDNRLAAHRKDLLAEVEKSAAASGDAAEQAKAGAQRLDREVTGIKSEAAKVTQRIDQIKASTDKLEQGLKVTQDEAAALKTALDGVRGDFSGQMKSTAKPADVAMAVAPLAAKVQTLETSVQNVVKAEEDRKTNAERIVLSLELGNLKRAMERGLKYAPELAEVRKVAGNRVNLATLEKFQNDGVPTVADLGRAFRAVASGILDADAQLPDSSVVDKLLTGAKSIVRVRKTTHEPGDKSAEAVVARMETALKETRLADVIAEAKNLSPKAAAPAQDWLQKVDARRTVDAALTEIDAQLKSSLGAGPAAKGSK